MVLIDPKVSKFAYLPLAYLAGLGIQTLFMFYMAVAHVKLTLQSVGGCLLILTLFLLLSLYIFKKGSVKSYFLKLKEDIVNFKITFTKKMSLLDKILLVIVAGLFVYVFLIGLYWPVVGWDSIALYDWRAKVFYLTGYMDDAIRRGYFFGYPLMTSMAHTWVYLLRFKYPKFLYSFMYISFSILFYEFIKNKLPRWVALMATLFMMTSYQIFANAAFDYTNLPYTIYFFISSVFLFKWFKDKSISSVVISAIFMGLAVWIRSTDPFWVINLVMVFCVSLYRKDFKALLTYVLIFFPIQQSWSLYLTKMSPNVSTQVLVGSSLSIILRGFDVGRMVEVSIFIYKTVGTDLIPYICLFLISIFIGRKYISENIFFYILVLLNFGMLFFGAYLFSFIYPGWGAISESLGRMIDVFIPILIFGSTIGLTGIFNNDKK